MKTDAMIVFVTCSSKSEADAIAVSLLKKRLSACANIVDNISSRFWWGGKIEKAKEFLVILKTTRRSFLSIEREVKRLHSYEVPEIIALPIIEGSSDYVSWIKKNVL